MRQKTKGIENCSELQNLNFEPGESSLQMTDPANKVLSSGKDLYHVDASDSRVFVWNTPSFTRDTITKGLPNSFHCYLFSNRLLLLLASMSRSGTLQKYFMIVNIYNFLRAFHAVLYKIGGLHTCLHTFCCETAYLLPARDQS